MSDELTCPACRQTTTTGASPGQTVACPTCGLDVRVPPGEAAVPLAAFERAIAARVRAEMAWERKFGVLLLVLGTSALLGAWALGQPLSRLYLWAGLCAVVGLLAVFGDRVARRRRRAR